MTQTSYAGLADRVVLITGGASGIGAAFVRAFASQQARVAFLDIDAEAGEALVREVASACGSAPLFVPCDLLDIDALRAAMAQVRTALGDAAVLVNNAANDQRQVLAEVTPEEFDWTIGVNLKHVFFAAQAVVPQMQARGGGSIINMSSIGGIQAGGGVMTYRASKAAVIMFTKSAAIELAHYDIRVNAIAPGNIPTPILASSTSGKTREELERFEQTLRAQMRADRPLQREGTPEDVAEAALYLASDRARYVTGTVLPVDGGTVAGKVLRRRSEQNN
jgi:NAD(P)-dependent dehydrogenase (short-subunit alcohol dehydrogenase family)